ncbi:MAG: ThuA domain-containing protein [Acidobacteria bacterium]|nr:ThuA domain-containing protein [Acidobacteriota bacterium]
MSYHIHPALLAIAAVTSAFAQTGGPPHVVFVTGDHEYSGEHTLPVLARELEQHYRMRATVLYATTPDGRRDENYEQNIPGLDTLDRADLAVFYLRWRQLPKEQVESIRRYLDSGKPVFGFRTSSHAFRYPKGHELERWNGFGEFAFGTPPGWGAKGHRHCGHECSTDVSAIPAAAREPILTGVDREFHVRSWLYHVPDYPPADATRLLMGKAVKPNSPTPDNPVAWTWRTPQGGRAFYTSMGHPEDFQVAAFQRLVINAIHWALGRPVPEPWAGKFEVNASYHGIRPSKPAGK